MNCDDCRQQLHARLDGESAPGDDLDAHLVHCAECRGLHHAAHRLRLGLLAAPTPEPPLGLADRIVASVLRDRRKRLLRRRLVFGSAGLAAAAALLVAFLWPPTSSNQLAQHDPAPTHRDDIAPPPSLHENVTEATSAVATLARRTADETVSNGQLFVSSVPLPLPREEGTEPPLDPPTQSLREAGQGVATGLEPVANSARRAFTLFLRDIPPMTPEAKSGL